MARTSKKRTCLTSEVLADLFDISPSGVSMLYQRGVLVEGDDWPALCSLVREGLRRGHISWRDIYPPTVASLADVQAAQEILNANGQGHLRIGGEDDGA